jgi:hypothetical protein
MLEGCGTLSKVSIIDGIVQHVFDTLSGALLDMAQPIEAGDASGAKPPRTPWPAAEKISRHSLMNRQLMSPAITELLFRASVIFTR